MSERAFAQVLALAIVACGAAAVLAQQRVPSGRGGGTPRAADTTPRGGTRLTTTAPRSVTFTPEREAAAQTFVRLYRPELLAVLDALKASQPQQYQRAICDLFWTSESLAKIREQDSRWHELALKTWQLESQTHLLALQLASQPEDAEPLRAELEQTVGKLVDAQLESSAYEIKRMEAQLRRAQDRQQKLAARRDELVRERLAALEQIITQSGDSAGAKP